MNIPDKNKEDELFLEFLNNNPGAMQLYNMVLQQELTVNPNSSLSAKSPRKSISIVGSLMPAKSPGKNTARVLPIGKSPQRSTSTTSVLGKSPAKQPLPIGKSPKKSTSATNLKPLTPSRKSWTKVDNSLDPRPSTLENENIPLTNNNFNTPKNDVEEPKAKRLSLKSVVVLPLSLPMKNEDSESKSPNKVMNKTISNRGMETFRSLTESNPVTTKSPGSKKPQITSKSSKAKEVKPSKKVKKSKEGKEVKDKDKDGKKKKKTSKEDGPPAPRFIPIPPSSDQDIKFESLTDPNAIFSKLVSIFCGLDLSPKTSHHKPVKYAFSGSQMIDWLMDKKVCKTRQSGIQIALEIQRLGLFESVSRGDFKDSKTLFTLTTKGRAIRSAKVLQYFSMAFDPKDGVEIKDRVVQLKRLKMCFIGEELVTWFLANHIVTGREFAVKIGKEFIDSGLIEHVSQEYHFKDDRFYYSLTREGTIQRMQASTVETLPTEKTPNEDIKLKSSEEFREPKHTKEDLKITKPDVDPTVANHTSIKFIKSKPDLSSQNSREKLPRDEEESDSIISDTPREKPSKDIPNVLALHGQLSVKLALNALLPGSQHPVLSHIKTNQPSQAPTLLERVHKIKGPANRRLPQKYSVLSNTPPVSLHQPEDTFTAPISNSARSSSSSLDELPRDQEDIKIPPKNPLPTLDTISKASVQNTTDQPEIISIPEDIIKLLTNETTLKSFRQFLVKSCKFHQIDYTDFLTEVYGLTKENNQRSRTLLKREIYKTYISETSPTFLHLPIALNKSIQSSMDSRTLSNNVFAESSAWVSEKLNELISEYFQASKVVVPDASVTEKKEVRVLKCNEEDCFMYNLDFCFAVSSFKVNYLTKNSAERTEEVMNIVNKFLQEDKPKISINNPDNFFNVLNSIKSGSFKIDVFDKLISDVAEVLNATAKNPNESDVVKAPVTPGRIVSRLDAPNSTKKSVLGNTVNNNASQMVASKNVVVKPEVKSEPTTTTGASLITTSKDAMVKPEAKPEPLSIISDNNSKNTDPVKSWKPRIKPINDQAENIPKKDTVKKPLKPTELLDNPVYVRVTDRDPRTDLVIGRVWRHYYYKLNSEGTRLTCYLNSNEVPDLLVDLTKLNSINDIVESEQLSEQENSKFAWSIIPLKLLFACSSKEERTAWISFIRSKLPSKAVPPPEQKLTPRPLSDITPTAVSTSVSQKPYVVPGESNQGVEVSTTGGQAHNAAEEKFSIILRRFNKRGGIRVSVPDTPEKLLQLASEKLKITAVRIREVDTEAELSELSLLKPDMLVWVMTAEEELEFL